MMDNSQISWRTNKISSANLKGTGPITFHLGMDFTRDDNNTYGAVKCIEKLIKNYKELFGMKPNTI
jgi:hypothetical protein